MASQPVTRSSRKRLRTRPDQRKPCKSRCSVAGHGVRVLGRPAAIPQANRPPRGLRGRRACPDPRDTPIGFDENTDLIAPRVRRVLLHAARIPPELDHAVHGDQQPVIHELPAANAHQWISPRPILFVTGERAHSRYYCEDAYEQAAEPKELDVVPKPATSTPIRQSRGRAGSRPPPTRRSRPVAGRRARRRRDAARPGSR